MYIRICVCYNAAMLMYFQFRRSLGDRDLENRHRTTQVAQGRSSFFRLTSFCAFLGFHKLQKLYHGRQPAALSASRRRNRL